MGDFIFINNNYKTSTKRMVYIIFGTRPEVIKIYPIVQQLKINSKYFTYKIICTYQQEEMVKQIMEDFHIIPNISCKVMKKGQSLSILSSKLFYQLDAIYNEELPDITVVQGDTTTALIASLCSFYHKIPVAHIEAGLRTRRIYFPFPEEFNRQTISNIAKYNFCPTKLSSYNLMNEKRDYSSIYVVGNTVIDTLILSHNLMQNNPKIEDIKKLIYRLISSDKLNILLLTIHRRENYGEPFKGVMSSIYMLLKDFSNITIIYPIHLNPNVMNSLKQTIPYRIFYSMINNERIEEDEYLYLNRLIIIKPVGYFSLIYLLNHTYFILTDSGGIQEEAVYLQKPILILRNTTERMEGVISNSAKLVGTKSSIIYHSAKELLINKESYKQMIHNPYIYGDGKSAVRIVNILKSDKSAEKYYSFTSLVIILTVWKRNNLLIQLKLIQSQSIIKNMFNISIIVYQNSNYISIADEIEKWKILNPHINLNHIHTNFDTGYYGRFLAPLTDVESQSYFILCDDDVLFGSRYFENMIRVVDSGSLATRNGRYIDSKGNEISTDKFVRGYFTWEDDLEYDFGGHIWAGKIEWLKLVWQHPPPTLINCEDAWISIVLKKYYNISTKVPRCPLQENIPYKPTLCACSDLSAKKHLNQNIGNTTYRENSRKKAMKLLKEYYNFSGIIETNYKLYKKVKNSKKMQNNSIYNFTNDIMENNCLYFI